uniref:MYND-type domain-containing protein n=1 Tax=Chromera velia CCMP2878 TaxID=1169474 RepID=A0A0G4GPT6_9ALVE|eukprot:Cvel_22850.t1-p1 / transcript=Cvel_22850.t1 / gene=Cvel_22850 / organism=Chromera_velia_CCMP2878 / gene_product=hypothetical protein / transcript_product=hypothetical protein / location=Cvel_scaffold2291:24344-24625(+) / protein_length=94 / sequence_SO=supercontig / SO=protein_coding / is_pseudo=false
MTKHVETYEKEEKGKEEEGEEEEEDTDEREEEVVDNEEENEGKNEERCAACGIGGAESRLLKCSGCLRVKYCSKVCQKRHWTDHRPDCDISLRA